jgi:hypothetical protein
MATIYNNQKFSFRDANSGTVFSNLEFQECYFQGCSISVTYSPSLRTTIRDVKLINCSQRGCTIHPAIIEDTLVDGFDTHGQLVQVWGAVFNRVVLRGKIDRLMISSVVDVMRDKPEVQEAFDQANDQYYKSIEWAVDISQASFKELDLRGVPARLIRRDPETQVVVTREKALRGEWRDLPLSDGLWKTTLHLFLQDNSSDIVLVAPKRHRKFRQYLADLKSLQAAGVAESE